MNILLVRHAQSEANRKGHHQGRKNKWSNTGLSKEGKKQALILSERLKNEPIDKIYSSPLKRTKQTTTTINKYHHLPVTYDKRLQEYRDEETKEAFRERITSFLTELGQQRKKHVLIVTHGRTLLELLARVTKNKIPTRNLQYQY